MRGHSKQKKPVCAKVQICEIRPRSEEQAALPSALNSKTKDISFWVRGYVSYLKVGGGVGKKEENAFEK